MAGSGTAFFNTMCPAGAGPAGLVTYSTGTVTLTHGSASVTGNGTSWSTANNVIAGYALRVTATHGGVPFVFHAPISSVGGTTSITLARAFPADADDGSYSYQIVYIDNRHAVLYYTRADGSTAKTYFQTSGCESDTAMYLYYGHDVIGVNGTTQTSQSYSYTDGFGYASALGANFYGEGMAHRALYYRSGLQMALDAANAMDDNYVKSPFVAGGDVGGIPLLLGGGVIGSFVNAILNQAG